MYWDGVKGGVVYWCREHVMTSYNTEGYAHLDFSPTMTFTDVKRICWDMNASNLGGRKWTEISVVPVELFESNGGRLDYVNPTFAPDGPGGWGLAVEPGMAMITIQQGSIAGHGTLSGDIHAVFLDNANKMDRLQTCVTADGEVSQELADGSQRVTELEGTLPQGPVRIIWADVSYNPDKAVDESPATVGNPYTWHWDNFIVE